MKKVILLTVLSMLFIGCSNRVLTKRAATTFATLPGIYGYEFRFMKLTEGSIPMNSKVVMVGDSTFLNLRWTQEFESKPLDDQVDPDYPYGVTNDTTVYFVPDSNVLYDDATARMRIVEARDIFVELMDAPYGVQVRGSIWNSRDDRAVWSKWSDMFAFFAHVPIDPPARAVNLLILE